MPLLHVAFKDGFENDALTVRVNGVEVFRRAGITTKNQISFADSFETDAPAGDTTVSIQVLSKGECVSSPLRLRAETYIGISLDERGRVSTPEVSSQPFGYA